MQAIRQLATGVNKLTEVSSKRLKVEERNPFTSAVSKRQD